VEREAGLTAIIVNDARERAARDAMPAHGQARGQGLLTNR
jgi:hypothetical protein